MMVRNLSAGLGPDVTPIDISYDTPVCEDDSQIGAHKTILDLHLQFLLLFGEQLKGGRTATGLGPNVTSIAAPFHELGPSVTLTCSLQFFMVINSLSSLAAILGPVLLCDCIFIT